MEIKTSQEIQYEAYGNYNTLIENGKYAGNYKRPTGKKLKEAKVFDNKKWIALDDLLKVINKIKIEHLGDNIIIVDDLKKELTKTLRRLEGK